MTPMLDGCTPWPEEFVDRYWAAGHWRGNTLHNLLRGWAVEYGPRTAVVHGATRLTYAALDRRVGRMAAGFRLLALRPGQRVVVQLPNVPEFVVTVFALMRAGAVPVLCPLSLPPHEVAGLVRLTQAVGYVGPSTYRGFDHTAMAAGIAADGPFLRRVFTYEAPGTASPYGGFTIDPSGCHHVPLGSVDAPPERDLALSADNVAFMLLSAGTRPGSVPPLVPRTHNDYAYQMRAAAELVALTGSDAYLAALPPENNVALGCPGILGTLSVGGTVVLVDAPEPAACLPVIERERVTIVSAGPAVAELWLDALPAARADVTSLRLVQIGDPPAVRSHHREPVGRTGPGSGCRLQRVVGGAEGPLVFTPPADPEDPPLAAHGRPLSPDDEIRIVAADGEDLPDGEPGELLARGPYTPRGYYRAPARNARRFTTDGYLRTGVLAYRTADGGLVTTGHLADDPLRPGDEVPSDR
ncbi:AMP-binding protein [Streptomyces sp. NPDC053755]|uniref:AMP-binding protein n=1 Tax=Streptomyces sp. NPDC053755 TaxID=3155815 RepID=UPI0034234069